MTALPLTPRQAILDRACRDAIKKYPYGIWFSDDQPHWINIELEHGIRQRFAELWEEEHP